MRLHVFVQALKPGAKARDLLAGAKLVAEAGFGGSETLTAEDLQAVWAPDGQSIVFAATTNRNAAAYSFVYTHLYQVSAAGAEPKQLTRGEESYFHPVFRPDGRALYCLYNARTDKVYTLERVAKLAWPAPGERGGDRKL